MSEIAGAGKGLSTTLENLQAAFNGESNARVRYLAFAAQAAEEGYGPVASLFRAAARAEEIHAANHAAVIQKLGAVPQADIEAPDIRSTRENLEAAISGETYERDVMYAEFFEQAKMDGIDDAANSFFLAKEVEAEHARLYTGALDGLERLRGGPMTYYVCPVCSTPVEMFEEVR
jgi:rubrerythrin